MPNYDYQDWDKNYHLTTSLITNWLEDIQIEASFEKSKVDKEAKVMNRLKMAPYQKQLLWALFKDDKDIDFMNDQVRHQIASAVADPFAANIELMWDEIIKSILENYTNILIDLTRACIEEDERWLNERLKEWHLAA